MMHQTDHLQSPLILIAEDEPDISDILIAYLKKSGFQTACAMDGEKALMLHLSLKPSLVLLDIQMPKLDGWKVLAEIRNRGNTPVIMLTAMDQDIDKLMGLRLGADDYVVKPFNPAEVVARVEAVLRRSRACSPLFNDNDTLHIGPIHINLKSHQVTGQSAQTTYPLSLTLTEFKLLAHLMRKPKIVCSRDELLVHCLPEGDTLERTVDSHISKLRKKLEDIQITGIPVSIRGVGYKFWDKE